MCGTGRRAKTDGNSRKVWKDGTGRGWENVLRVQMKGSAGVEKTQKEEKRLYIIRYSDGLISCLYGSGEEAVKMAEKYAEEKDLTYVII